MKIYDESDHLLCDSDQDQKKYEQLQQNGVFTVKSIFVKHHDAIIATQEEIAHKATVIYFTDGTSQNIEEEDPHIVYDSNGYPQWHELENDTHHYFGMTIKPVVVKEGSVAKPAWDEYEDVLIYRPYTEEEFILQQQEKDIGTFINKVPELYSNLLQASQDFSSIKNKINNLQFSINGINLAMAETFEDAVFVDDISYKQLRFDISNMCSQINHITLYMAELVGVDESKGFSMLSGLKYGIVEDAAIIRVTQMGESIEDVVKSYTKLDDSQKEMLTESLKQAISNKPKEE